ncbi:MAG: TIGR01620 family protein [Pseudolabrys sp.]|nr:TIGR01620 family protein [Pseudolabrys sp.]
MSTLPPRAQGPRVIADDAAKDVRPFATPHAPFVLETEETERVVPRERAAVAQTFTPPMPRKRDRWVRLGLYGIAAALVGWLGIDAYQWINNAFASSLGLGIAASAFVAAGFGGAALIIGREVRSFFALKSVEEHQQRFAEETLRPADMREAIRDVLAVVPKDKETEAAIEAFQRQVQAHHTPAQQLEVLSRTVMTPLDRRAEALVRRSTAAAFGITAVSPTAITDVLFFVAMSIRMVRGVAACYGHRPTAAATVHLLRRLMTEAGKLGAVDLAGMTLTQHIGGALAERIATNTAESMYAGQRMARIGLITMSMCRPVPFLPEEVPGMFSSMIGNLFSRKPDKRG